MIGSLSDQSHAHDSFGGSDAYLSAILSANGDVFDGVDAEFIQFATLLIKINRS
jgi:hypothetical protein